MKRKTIPKTVVGKTPSTKKNRNIMATATCFCLLGFSQTAFSQQSSTKQINSTNQLVWSPIMNPDDPQASANPTRKFDPPYPYTADQLKEKLLKVVALKDAPKDGAEILEIFDLPVTEYINVGSEKLLAGEMGFILNANHNWYFTMAYRLDEKSKIGNFIFHWPKVTSKVGTHFIEEQQADPCIKENKFIEEREKTGWQLKRRVTINEIPHYSDYIKNDKVKLRLTFFSWNNCLFRVELWWANADFINDF